MSYWRISIEYFVASLKWQHQRSIDSSSSPYKLNMKNLHICNDIWKDIYFEYVTKYLMHFHEVPHYYDKEVAICQIIEYVTLSKYNDFLVPWTCHIQVVGLYLIMGPDQCVCLTKFLQVFSLLTCKYSHKKRCMSVDMHNLEVDMYCDLWRKKPHVNWYARNWNDTYYKAT